MIGGVQPYAPAAGSTPLNPTQAQRFRAALAQNLQARSEEFDNSTVWTPVGATVTANAAANPIDGLVTADALVDTAANTTHSVVCAGGSGVSFPEGTSCCFSVWVKLAKPGTAPVALVSSAGALGSGGTYFNLVTGARNDVLFPETYSKCEDFGNGWFRLSVFGRSRSNGLSQMNIGFYADTAGTTYLGNGTAVAYIWGAQLTATRGPAPYVKAAATPIGSLIGTGAPTSSRSRLDYESNSCLQSEAFDDTTFWGNIDVVLTPNAAPGPYGGANTADLWADPTEVGTHIHELYQIIAPPVSWLGRVVTFSVYVKPVLGSGNYMLMLCNAQTAYANFDLVNGLYVGPGGTTPLVSASCEQVGGGWLRCSITFVATTFDVSCFPANAGTVYIYQGAGVSRFYTWGAQLNEGYSATPYVKTSAAYPGVHADTLPARVPA